MTSSLPKRVISWYGDDFTGSTDALEALAPHLPAVLFLKQPDESIFQHFTDYSAFGLAGSSRSESPEWMDAHLAGAFAWMGSLDTAVTHYKVCSTFDSSPRVGSIGRATEIGKRVFGSRFVPIVVGVPSLGRYTFFGNLFANASGTVHRIDRHPTMKHHPVTPMDEADLRLHLKKQADLRIGLLSVPELNSPYACERYRSVSADHDAVLIDVIDERTLEAAGRLIWSVDRQRFLVGSSGVEYALIAGWKTEGLIGDAKQLSSPGAVDRLVVLSGSCSPVTERQIAHAVSNGFTPIRLNAAALTTGEGSSDDDATRSAVHELANGRSVVLFTAASPGDRIETFASTQDQFHFRQRLSERCGQILNQIVDQSGVERIVIAGGDTSSHAGRQLGIDALTFISHMAPGAPLCRTWSSNQNRHNLQIVFKGGQCGQDDFFEKVLNGGN